VLRLLFPHLSWLGAGSLLIWGSAIGVALTLAHPSSPASWSVLAGPADQHTPAATPISIEWGSTSPQADALWRAALLATTNGGSTKRALNLLDQLLREHPASPRAPDARARRAMLLDRQGSPDAAAAWQAAAEAAPEHPRAGRWWLAAADHYSASGRVLTAQEAYEAATAYPSEAAVAWVAIGRLTLAHDPAAAHAAFSSAASAAQRPSTLRLARLGTATALERLEGPEAALAEVDDIIASEGTDPSLERRRDRLRNGG
jgi:tetratricopeptide (TPR) repeat protein